VRKIIFLADYLTALFYYREYTASEEIYCDEECDGRRVMTVVAAIEVMISGRRNAY
jgi:hypothetical protein